MPSPAPYGPLTYEGLIPASSSWRESDPVGDRVFCDLGPLTTESGFTFPRVRVAYETWGVLNSEGSNAIFISHALTGDSHVTGPAGPGHRTAGWWDALVGPGRAIDTDEWFVVCANVLGGCQGTTGPSSLAPDGRPWGSRFPIVTVSDMVEVELRLTDALGIKSWALMLGPSLGGMRVLEWMVSHPDSVMAGLVLGSTAAVSADQIGTHHTQLLAIYEDPAFLGGDYYESADGTGPHSGMGIARRIAHLTYRSAIELDERFGRDIQKADPNNITGATLASPIAPFAIASYLDHHADKLSRRFDANTYITLTNAMSLFDLGRGRGGVETALRQIKAPLTVIAIDSDRLFPSSQQQQIVDHAIGADELQTVHSLHGHDGFLVEDDQVSTLIRQAVNRARKRTTTA